MEVFISFRYSGESVEEIKNNLNQITFALEKANHNHYHTLSEDSSFQKKTIKQMIEHAFKKIDKADIFLAFINSEQKSEGMLIELGYAMSKKKRIIIAIKKGITATYIPTLTKDVIEFENMEDLTRKLEKIK